MLFPRTSPSQSIFLSELWSVSNVVVVHYNSQTFFYFSVLSFSFFFFLSFLFLFFFFSFKFVAVVVYACVYGRLRSMSFCPSLHACSAQSVEPFRKQITLDPDAVAVSAIASSTASKTADACNDLCEFIWLLFFSFCFFSFPFSFHWHSV